MRYGSCGRLLAARVLACSSVIPLASAASAAQDPSEAPAPERGENDKDVIVLGKRGSAVTDVAPVATFDADVILATGASNMGELLRAIRGTTQSADGSDPIFLINAQRVPSYQEINALPPEALEKIEVLPEPAALKFGFPPTRRVINFITKRHFRQVELRASATLATRGGATTEKAGATLTRLQDDRRLTLGLEYRHTDPLLQSDRGVVPNPDILFDVLGNVRGVNGEIDPALSAAVGRTVSVAGVPDAAADQSSLSAYANSADKPRLFDGAPFRTLVPGNDTVKVEGVLADRIGDTLSGSLSLSAEHSRDRSLGGPASATLIIPAGNPFSPFSRTVLLDRYLTEAPISRQNQDTTTLHAAFLLRGAVSGWQWDVTGTLDQKLIDGLNERNFDMTRANAAIAAGANPFAPLDLGLLTDRLTDLAHLRTRSAGAKGVITNTPIRLPAGKMAVTGTLEAERLASDSTTRGPNPSDLHLGRTRTEAGLSIDIPLTSRREKVLPALGDISVNASVRARNVSGFGALNDSTFGLNWSPIEGLQFLGSIKRSAAAPDVISLSSPVLVIPDAFAFDYATGRTERVTVIQGGNPDLAAEHRLVRSLGVTFKPWAKRELRLSATYEETTIRDQTGLVYSLSPQTQAVLPDLFVRDGAGKLLSVAYQPINFAVERVRSLAMTLNFNGQLAKPGPPAAGATAQPPIILYFGAGPTIKFSDRLQLRPGTPELDLLRGDTVTGGPMPRVSGYTYGGINYRDLGLTFSTWYAAGTRLRNVDPAGDLRFAPYFQVTLGGYVGLQRLVGNRPWARQMQLRLDIENLTSAYQRVRDPSGRIPDRYQSGYTIGTGRTVTVTLRKRF